MNEREIKEQKLLIFETSINCLEQLLATGKSLLEKKNTDNNVAIAILECSTLAITFEDKASQLHSELKMTTKDIYTALAQSHIELADAIFKKVNENEASNG